MKLKQKLKPFIYAAAVLCMSISCKTNDPNACGSGSKLTCIANLKNVKADYTGAMFEVEKYGAVSVCPTCEDKVIGMNLKPSYIAGTNVYKYRMWGQIYRCDDCPVISINSPKVLLMYVDKVETIN